MLEGIPRVEREAYLSSYSNSPGTRTKVHGVLVTPQKYPRIFIIILLYIMGMH